MRIARPLLSYASIACAPGITFVPANSGGKQRSLAVLQRLARQGSVVLCAFDDGQADKEGLRAMGVEVRSVPWHPTPGTFHRSLLISELHDSGRYSIDTSNVTGNLKHDRISLLETTYDALKLGERSDRNTVNAGNNVALCDCLLS